MAGGVRFGALVSDVTVAGDVTGGKVADYKETNTHAAVGGLVGYVDKASVTGSIAFGKVAMDPNYPSPNAHSWYTLGGGYRGDERCGGDYEKRGVEQIRHLTLRREAPL